MPPRGSGWVKKPDYKSIRRQLIKSKCIDDNTGFMILNLRSKDIFISKSDNTIMIIFQDFKQIFNLRSKDNIFSLTMLRLTRNLDQLDLLSQLTNLTKLYLNCNKLTNLPSEIGNLTNLTNLDLRGNKLTNIPSEIGNLTNLTQLSLSFNKLTNLPSEIGNLINLTGLSLYYNKLTNIPKPHALYSLRTTPCGLRDFGRLPHEV